MLWLKSSFLSRVLFSVIFGCCLWDFRSCAKHNRKFTREETAKIPKRAIRQVTTECGGYFIVNGFGGKLRSPNYPSSYGSDLDCKWRLMSAREEGIILHIKELHIEAWANCSNDHLDIYSGPTTDDLLLRRLCGKIEDTSIFINSTAVLLVLTTDSTFEESGFEIEFRLANNPKNNCDQRLTKPEGTITSPGFPKTYPIKSDCFTLITVPENEVVYLTFDVLKLEADEKCAYDYCAIYDGPTEESPLLGRYCYSESVITLKSTKNKVFVHFHSDDILSEQGFLLKYSTDGFVDKSGNIGDCGWTQTENGGVITNPKYPENYPSNSLCKINIMAPENYLVNFIFTDLSLEPDSNCSYDNIVIQEGACSPDEKTLRVLCGSLQTTLAFSSTTNNVLFTFTSDGSSEFSGFNMRYTFVEDPSKVKPKNLASLNVRRLQKIEDSCGAPKQGYPGGKDQSITGRIVGGNDAEKGAFPWQVMLWDPKNQAFCGGVLLNERWFASAAHCFTSRQINWNQTRIRLGKLDQFLIEPEEFSTMVGDIVIHPSYNCKPFDNDLALVRFKDAVTFNDYILPICLGTSKFIEDNFFSKENQLGFVTGWGKLAKRGIVPRILQEVQLPLIKRSICEGSTTYQVTRNMFCAGYVQGLMGDSCEGDSGSPFVTEHESQWYLLGLVSSGAGCAQYGYYTKVNNYHNWIKEIIST